MLCNCGVKDSKECGKYTVWLISIFDLSASPYIVLTKSPKPSIDKTDEFSKPDRWNALEIWDKWCWV